jgi:hypothetical protein
MSPQEITLAPHEYRRIVKPSMPAGRRALCAAFGSLLLWAGVSLGWSLLQTGILWAPAVLAVFVWGAMGGVLIATALWPNGDSPPSRAG